MHKLKQFLCLGGHRKKPPNRDPEPCDIIELNLSSVTSTAMAREEDFSSLPLTEPPRDQEIRTSTETSVAMSPTRRLRRTLCLEAHLRA